MKVVNHIERMGTLFTQSSQVTEKSALQIELQEPIFVCRIIGTKRLFQALLIMGIKGTRFKMAIRTTNMFSLSTPCRLKMASLLYAFNCLRLEYCSCPSLGSQHKHILVRPPGMAEVSKMQEQFSTKKNARRRSTHRGDRFLLLSRQGS